MDDRARQRDAAGRFLPGHRGGPGRPRRRGSERDFDAVAVRALTPARWGEVVELAYLEAVGEDLSARARARSFLLSAVVERGMEGRLRALEQAVGLP